MPRKIFFFIALLVTQQTFSQEASGSWYGRADVVANGVNNNYLAELILKQKGDQVEGIFGYYFKDSYQSFFVRGKYDQKTRYVSIKNLPIIYFRSLTRDGIECPMTFEGRLLVSQAGSSIRGSFYSDDKYKYTCPELRIRFILDANITNQDSVLENAVTGQKFWQPQQEDFLVTTPANKKAVTIQADVSNANTAAVELPKLNADSEKELIEKFEERKNTYGKDLIIDGDSVRVSFYDNGDIDGDSITVFLNHQPILAHQEITARALNLYLKLDSTKDVNEISMFADNLGTIPPNTALMIVTDGINRYEVYLSSSLTQNASIRLRKRKK